MKRIALSILDQSIVREGGDARSALEETIATARLAERLGYRRFWVSEHHNSTMIAGSAPEVLMVKLADETSTIRIGSGGIMMPNHSTLKVAENFRMLETLFPGRIDLGMGRAPGGDRITASLLNPSNTFDEEDYLRQLTHLQAYFRDEAGTQYGPVLAVPQSSTIPDQWVLSSSGGSSTIAGRFGMGLAVARFINGFAGREVVDSYRRSFQPGALQQPQELLAIQVLCAETEEQAKQMRTMSDFVLLQFEKGIFEPMRSYESIRDYVYSPAEQERIRHNSGRIVSGTPEQVHSQLTRLAEEFDIGEIMVSCNTYSAADRRRCFELLAEVFAPK